MIDIQEYLIKTKTVLLTQESFHELLQDARNTMGILQEIREEINKIRNQPLIDYVSSISVVDTALEIIDKHIKEYTE